MAGAGARHIAMGEIDLRLATGMAIGGIPAVFVAAFIVKTMPLELLRWMVIVGEGTSASPIRQSSHNTSI